MLFLLLYQIPPPKESVLTRIFKKVLSNTSFKPFVLRKFRCKRLSAYLYRFCNSRLFLPFKRRFPTKKGKSVGSSPTACSVDFQTAFSSPKKTRRVVFGNALRLRKGDSSNCRDFFQSIPHKRGTVDLAPERFGRKIGAVGFTQQPVFADRANKLRAAVVLEGNRAAESKISVVLFRQDFS